MDALGFVIAAGKQSGEAKIRLKYSVQLHPLRDILVQCSGKQRFKFCTNSDGNAYVDCEGHQKVCMLLFLSQVSVTHTVKSYHRSPCFNGIGVLPTLANIRRMRNIKTEYNSHLRIS
jgi:hypothetical protein